MVNIKIPYITGLTGGVVASATAATLLSGTSHTTKNDDLKKIQVYFYDKENKDTKTMRINLSIPFSSSSMEIPKTNQNSSGNTWEKLDESIKNESDENKPKKKAMWNTLFDIASNYIHTQHQLNIIKANQKANQKADSDLNTKLQNLCKNGQCCCQTNGQKCDCTKNNCCKMCLCCYSKDSSGNCCCKNPSQSNCHEELIKSHKTFKYLLGNLDSSWTGQYLQPIEAHIKLSDLKFSDLETSDESSSTSNSEQKPFIGTLVYGFVDYWYKSKKYKQALPKQNSSEYSSLEENKDYWFVNIPQRFTFTHKKDNNSTKNDSDKENIEIILKSVKDTEQVKKLAADSDIPDPKLCCKNESDVVKCLLSRNYIYLEKDSLENKFEYMKNISDCCSGSSSS